MASSFIGKYISLVTYSDMRYRGKLAGINPAASTIQLSNVFSMGTEARKPPEQYIPPVPDPYEYIIFRASEVKDIAVDDMQPPLIHHDPAVVGSSAPIPSATSVYAQQAIPQQPLQQPQVPQQQQQQQPQPQQQQRSANSNQAPSNPNPRHAANQARRTNSINSANASLEVVERALGDLRIGSAANAAAAANTNPHHSRNGAPKPRRNGAVNTPSVRPEVPTTDFDFESSNARFDKAALAKSSMGESGSDTDGEGKPEGEKGKDGSKSPAYDPTSSFFDSLSPGPAPAPSNRTRGGRGGPGGRGGRGSSLARTRREEERQRNVATFGEPGGVGLMGPGAYVGGWGRPHSGGRGRGRSVVSGAA